MIANIKKRIAMVTFGRSHWLKLPHLGMVILTNRINELEDYTCEMFDYCDFPVYSLSGDHFSIINYNAFGKKYPVGFIPELPIIDLFLRYAKNLKCREKFTIETFREDILENPQKLRFLIDFCEKIGLNSYLLIEMLERFIDRFPQMFEELVDFQYIGFYNNTASFFGTLILSELIRYWGKKTTFGGGPQITSTFNYMLQLVNNGLFYDYIVSGDAEDYIGEILQEISQEQTKSFQCYKKRNLAKVEEYFYNFNFDCVLNKGYKYHHLIYDLSRGCPGRCSFCGEYKIHGRTGIKNPIKAAEHLVALTQRYENHPDFIPLWRIGDSLINFDENYLHQFLDHLIALKKKSKSLYVKGLSFYGYARGNITDDLAKKLWTAGCRTLWIGVEAFSNEALQFYNKQLTIEQMTRSILDILKNKVSVGLLLVTPSNAILKVPENFVYNELKGIKEFIKKIILNINFLRISSGPFPYDQQVGIVGHTLLTMINNSSLHYKFPIENWDKGDFFEITENRYHYYENIPRNYVLKNNMKQVIQDYWHRDQILRKLFPINKDSTLTRIDTILEYSAVGNMNLKTFEHNILGTPDYFSLSQSSPITVKQIREYLSERSKT
jgi:hypothetical protein